MTRTITLLSAVGCIIVMSACTHPQAKTVPDGPPLDMPAPPPRDVEPSDPEVPAPMPLPEEPAHRAPTRPRPTQREPPKTDVSKPEPAKPEPPVVEPPKPADEPKPAAPPTTLQTTPADEEGAVERLIRGSLARARTDLNRIDYRVLNTDARTQYDTAKRWVEQAEDAIKAKNLVFAKTLAENAATLAARLARK